MSADNYIRIKRFGSNDYRWGMWFASEDNPDFSDKNYKHGPFYSAENAAKNAEEECLVIEYGIEFDDNCYGTIEQVIDLQNRLNRIAQIIEDVDQRCMAADGPVTPTLEEMTQEEISEIYELASR